MSTPQPLPASAVADIFHRFALNNPEPTGELAYTNAYTLLVAVVLSAQATDKGVNSVTPVLFAQVSTPQDMLDLGEPTLLKLISSIGLFRSKAKYLINGAKMLVEHHQGHVPADLDALTALPGVGRKTANVVLNTAFGADCIAVDTHVFRVANRTGIAPAKTPDGVEQALLSRLPADAIRHAHHWMILHGRYVCRARKPACASCLIADLCSFPDKTP